jgi:hypothetical protein
VSIRLQARIAPEVMTVLTVIAAVSGLLILVLARLPEVLDAAILLFSAVVTGLLVVGPAVWSRHAYRRAAASEVLDLILRFLLRRFR